MSNRINRIKIQNLIFNKYKLKIVSNKQIAKKNKLKKKMNKNLHKNKNHTKIYKMTYKKINNNRQMMNSPKIWYILVILNYKKIITRLIKVKISNMNKAINKSSVN